MVVSSSSSSRERMDSMVHPFLMLRGEGLLSRRVMNAALDDTEFKDDDEEEEEEEEDETCARERIIIIEIKRV